MRALHAAAATVGTVLLFLAALLGGVLLHLNTARARSLLAVEVNRVLAPSFRGRIAVTRIGGVGIFGVTGTDGVIADPSGRPVLDVRGARVGIATLAAVRSALLDRKNPLAIDLSGVAIDSVDLRLDTDADGQLVLLDALSSPGPSGPPDPHARGLRLTIPDVALEHAWVHGRPAGAPVLDVDLDHLKGTVRVTPEAFEAAVVEVRVVARGIANGADVDGALAGRLRLPSDPSARPEGRVTWRGRVGAVLPSIDASLARDHLDATVDVGPCTPEHLRTVWPGSPLTVPATVHVDAHGELDDVLVHLDARAGSASIQLGGHVSAVGRKSASLTIAASAMDVHQLAPAAPPSSVDVTGDLAADQSPDGALHAATSLRVLGMVAGQRIPPASVHATISRDPSGHGRGDADLTVAEPGGSLRASATAASSAGGYAVTFDAQATASELAQVPQLENAIRGNGRLSASGHLDTARDTVDASAHLEAAALTLPRASMRIESAWMDARATGSLRLPSIDAKLCTRGLVAGGRRLASVDLTVRGSATEPRVTAAVRASDLPDVDASAELRWSDGVSLQGVRVAVGDVKDRALLTARTLALVDGGLRGADLRLEGLGAPLTASFEATRDDVTARVATGGIDLARVARLAHLGERVTGGTIALDADVRLTRAGGRGRVALDVTGVNALGMTGANAHVQATLDRRDVGLTLRGGADGLGTLEIDAPKVVVGAGTLLSASAWRAASGALDLRGKVDLARLAALLPAGLLPVGEAAGRLQIAARVRRDEARETLPTVSLQVHTDGLVLAAPGPVERDIDGVLVRPLPRWRVVGIDADVDAGLDGGTRALRLTTTARDVHGTIAQIDLRTTALPYADVLGDAARRMRELRATPLEVHVHLPERSLGSLPSLLTQSYVAGRLHGDVVLRGTVDAPSLEVSATLRRASLGAGALTTPLDFELRGDYDGRRATASVHAHDGDRELLDLELQGAATWHALLDGSAGASWTASAKAHLASFPLESVPALDDKAISGKVSGDVSLTDLHQDAHADGTLSIDSLTVGSVAYKSAVLKLTADGHIVDASVRVDQTDGFLDAKAHALASWGRAMAPALDASQPLDAMISAKSFRVAALLPFVASTLDELDGRLDADAHVKLDPRSQSVEARGTMALRRGTLEAVAGGGELHDLSADLKVEPDGTITLEKLTASGLTGRVEASGTARLRGAALESAHATVVIPTGAAVPITAGGVEIGSVTGRFDATLATNGAGRDVVVKIEVPRLDVKLPEGSTTNAEGLGPMDRVRIGAHRGNPATFVLLPLDAAQRVPSSPNGNAGSRVTIQAHLAEVHVARGTDLKVDLTGRVNVEPGDPSRVTGQIALRRGGTLDVEGRTFNVDGGTVTFVGDDPSNPQVVVKASWTSPDATVVTATFTGPLKSGKVTLSSEPQLPNDEIVQLLLFGSADGKQALAPSSSTQNTALATAGGEAAQPLNHMLNQLGLGALTAKVDTSEAANPKPEVEVQIARDISVQLAVVLGQPPPGVNPDVTLLTLDWRFLSKWSLATTVGNAGTTIFDLLWQKRY